MRLVLLLSFFLCENGALVGIKEEDWQSDSEKRKPHENPQILRPPRLGRVLISYSHKGLS